MSFLAIEIRAYREEGWEEEVMKGRESISINSGKREVRADVVHGGRTS